MSLLPQERTHIESLSQEDNERTNKCTATSQRTNNVAEQDEEEYPMYAVTTNKNHPLKVKVNINNVDLQMEVDTGATLSIISK